jgi:hypothetical protein
METLCPSVQSSGEAVRDQCFSWPVLPLSDYSFRRPMLSLTFTYRDYRHASQRKDLTLSALFLQKLLSGDAALQILARDRL